MKSRLLAGVAAVVLALIGGLLVFSYAQGADKRAMEDLEPVQVIVVQEAVPAGTSAQALAEYVAVETLPKAAVPSTALHSLKDAGGKVTATDLVPGEPLLSGRLVAPAALQQPGSVPVPKGLQEVTFSLEPQRIVGGKVTAGDTVGIFVSFDGGALEDAPEAATTRRIFHKVLVTRVQRADPIVHQETGSTPNPEALPAGAMLITIAINDVDAAKVVFSAEFGTIWLTKEPAEASEEPPTVIQKSDVYS